ncbi:hypothetical protein [Bradyrhizobium sp. I1.14.4]|uniref:hypothetical protein n=1 Tax=unclassified Bradyrhizobium TaxID=2631580 RepID=UPI003D1FEB00
MRAIEQIIAGYVSLNDRQALEEVRDHRQRLLDDVRTRQVPGFKLSVLEDILREEIELVEAALARFDDDGTVSTSDKLEKIETEAAVPVVGDDDTKDAEPSEPEVEEGPIR